MGRPAKDSLSASKRIQMDMASSMVDRLKDLQVSTEAASYGEVVRTALKIYEHLLLEAQSGSRVYLKRNDEITRLLIPGA